MPSPEFALQIVQAIHEAPLIAFQIPFHPEAKFVEIVQELWDKAIHEKWINIE